jgi:hypothetical protein
MEALVLSIEMQIAQVQALLRAFALEQPSPKYQEITWQDRQSKSGSVSKPTKPIAQTVLTDSRL